MENIKLKCSCGAVEGKAVDISPNTGTRLVCYCDDCQAFAHYLGREEEIHLGDRDDAAEYPAPKPEAVSDLPNFQTAKAYAIREFEKSYLCDLLQLARGNVSQAARISGKERRALGKLIKKYSIDKAVYS